MTVLREVQLLMDRYKEDKIQMPPGDFRALIESLPGTKLQTGALGTRQSKEFVWGHDHDFGSWKIKGHLGNNHIRMMAWAIENYFSVRDKDVLDVGCWTGGATLLMHAMGAKSIVAIDENPHYPQALKHIVDAFDLGEQIWPVGMSLYDSGLLNCSYDTVWCAGVLYHLTDPIVGLRKIYTTLRQDGQLVLETAIIPKEFNETVLEYFGPSREGWCWFVPSVSCVRRMLRDCGFIIDREMVQHGTHWPGSRYICIATKLEDVETMQCGMSRYY